MSESTPIEWTDATREKPRVEHGLLKFDGPNEEFYDTRQVQLVQYS